MLFHSYFHEERPLPCFVFPDQTWHSESILQNKFSIPFITPRISPCTSSSPNTLFYLMTGIRQELDIIFQVSFHQYQKHVNTTSSKENISSATTVSLLSQYFSQLLTFDRLVILKCCKSILIFLMLLNLTPFSTGHVLRFQLHSVRNYFNINDAWHLMRKHEIAVRSRKSSVFLMKILNLETDPWHIPLLTYFQYIIF